MCGRFVTASSPDELANYFGAMAPDEELDSDYNVAPTKEVYVVRAGESHRRLSAMRWGLVPFWAKDLKIGSRMINARVETVADKPAFRKAYEFRRCLVPADGFYEWAKIPGEKRKQPYYVYRADGEPVVFAGLWERWRPRLPDSDERDESADAIETFTILTGRPNREMTAIHDRMPVMIPAASWDDWLDPGTDVAAVAGLLVPPPDDFLVLRPISTAVNSVRNNGPQLLDEVEPLGRPAGGDISAHPSSPNGDVRDENR